MKILVGLSKGVKAENIPYQMFIVDVDSTEPLKQDWQEVSAQGLSSCSNVRVNLGNYKSIMQNPLEYLEAEFDLSKIVDSSVNSREFQVINVYKDEEGNPILYRTINASGEVKMHHISEFKYNKMFSLYGEDINTLPSFVKPTTLKDAYEWWASKDSVKMRKRATRFVYENFETDEEMPVLLLYYYLIGVKGFQLGYHTITNLQNEEKEHEYFLFNKTANIKLKEIIKDSEEEEIAIYGNKNPYPDNRKIGYFGAVMSLICNRKNYPAFDYYSRPTSEANYDQEGIEATIDLTYGNMAVYNKFEEADCISTNWRLGENRNFFGITLSSLLPSVFNVFSKKFQNEKERTDFGHWSSHNTNEWFQVMAFALATQYFTKELRNALNEILNDYQYLFSTKLAEMIEKISAKDSLETMKWAEENVEQELKEISFIKEDGTVQNSSMTMEQVKNLFTFKRNSYDLPDWLQIYSNDTIEKLGGAEYLNQFIATRGEESAELYLSMWAEKIENDQKYSVKEYKKEIDEESDTAFDELDIHE